MRNSGGKRLENSTAANSKHEITATLV